MIEIDFGDIWKTITIFANKINFKLADPVKITWIFRVFTKQKEILIKIF